ncbi:MAG: hypothetical protein JWN44_2323 [Myxococcales bacterium]|nr:hypothetical protein [Myxococcales bacterium]
MNRLRGLDTRGRSVLNLCVRASFALLIVLLSSATAMARPKVQVAPFSVKGEALGYFGPEVARAMTAALEGAGVETGAGAEATITGHVEELSGERVRIAATLRGRTLTAEGPLEAADAVATQLANQIAPLLLENDPAAQKAAERRARDAERRAAAVPPSRPARLAASKAAAKSEPAAAKAEAPVEGKATLPPETKPPVAETDVKPAASEPKDSKGAEATKPEAKPEVKPDTRSDVKDPPKQPDWIPPRVDTPARPESPPAVAAAPSAPVAPSPYYGGFVRGRVVAHAVSDPPSSTYGTAGTMATQALFSFLHRRMRLSVIPTGVGVTSTAVAADEGYRAAARAVVMARLESVEYVAGGAKLRLEVVVVRDGRAVMRRVVESAPSDPSRRSFGTDPVYQSVTMALEALVPELVGALADVR